MKKNSKKSLKKSINLPKDDRNKNKLRASSKKALKNKQKKIPKKFSKKVEKLEEKLNESEKDVISINDPDARLMKNKKRRWEFDYNAQIAVDEHKGIIIASHVTNNPSDHHELIPAIEQKIKSKRNIQ